MFLFTFCLFIYVFSSYIYCFIWQKLCFPIFSYSSNQQHQDRGITVSPFHHQHSFQQPCNRLQNLTNGVDEPPPDEIDNLHQEPPLEAIDVLHQDPPPEVNDNLHQDPPPEVNDNFNSDPPLVLVDNLHQDPPPGLVDDLHQNPPHNDNDNPLISVHHKFINMLKLLIILHVMSTTVPLLSISNNSAICSAHQFHHHILVQICCHLPKPILHQFAANFYLPNLMESIHQRLHPPVPIHRCWLPPAPIHNRWHPWASIMYTGAHPKA